MTTDLAAKVKKAQAQDGAKGVIGGNFWNSKDILRNQRLPETEIVKFVYLAEGPNLTTDIALVRDDVPLHIHEVHDELIYVLQGTGIFRVADENHRFGAGSVIYIPQNTVHGGTVDGEASFLAVYAPRFDIRDPDRIFVDKNAKPI